MSIGPQLTTTSMQIKIILYSHAHVVFIIYTVKKIWELGHLSLYTQVFSTRNPMLKQCRVLLLLD